MPHDTRVRRHTGNEEINTPGAAAAAAAAAAEDGGEHFYADCVDSLLVLGYR